MNAEEILAKWSNDSKVDVMNIQSELARNGITYSTYLDLYIKYRVKKRKLTSNLEQETKTQLDWLKGRISINGKKYPFKLMNDDLKASIAANEEIQKLKERLEAVDITIDLLSKILDQIKQRSFDLRAIKDLNKIENGM